MLFTPHLLIGGAIGRAVPSPLLALSLGVISHFVFDFIPHFDQGVWHPERGDVKFTGRDWGLITLDLTISVAIVIYLISINKINITIVAGGLGGVLPDLIDNVPMWKYRIRKTFFGEKLHKFHTICHKYRLKIRLIVPAILFSIFVSILSILLLIV